MVMSMIPAPTGLSPRVRGNRYLDAVNMAYEGSIPRVRGNPLLTTLTPLVVWSIPACAGEPSGCGRWWRVRRVYPRVCGGTLRYLPAVHRKSGLSPRVRGNLLLDGWDAPPDGSIPACAGEPRVECGSLCRIRVYPRVCGGTHYP